MEQRLAEAATWIATLAGILFVVCFIGKRIAKVRNDQEPVDLAAAARRQEIIDESKVQQSAKLARRARQLRTDCVLRERQEQSELRRATRGFASKRFMLVMLAAVIAGFFWKEILVLVLAITEPIVYWLVWGSRA